MNIKTNAVAFGLACAALMTPAAWAVGKPTVSVQDLADSVVKTHDSHGQPFAVIDKVQARLFVFQPDGRIHGSSPILLGSARGDDSVPGIGLRKMEDIRPAERTTPAGRFLIEPGRNAQGEDIFWIDYDAAVSMHRVRATNPKERRLARLATATPADNRISYGCINVPVAFFNTVVKPVFQGRQGVMYVLPETRPAQTVFSALKANKPGS
ncbi:MAG: L,D-transpeptidase [Aquabacterium sp.]|uniref:L,D-transpeptidase n=1 Tax=Aquabacterium sp. TaxID=1872578 RepID=UPI002726933C|nr:L,D-transpeptidase [Aquabacterium sp.]MDO9004159.1 L,D-transpeptidase [Aquabacterium sp.]